jgi:oxygen-independent coproporphyrinogen-3 oxidase
MLIHSYEAGLKNDLAEEVRQFADMEDAEVAHEVTQDGGYFWHTVSVSARGGSESAVCRGAQGCEDARERKRLDKRAAKLACYLALCRLTGQTQPWGSLTGVRPTALLKKLDDSGQGHLLLDYYGVEERKYALARRILEVQEAAMQSVSPDAVCVYIGVPFCVSRCSYCSFPGRIAKPGEMQAYVDALAVEMAAAAHAINQRGTPVAAVYIGGGTPTCLPIALLDSLLTHTRRCFSAAPEFTLEAGRPDTIDADKLGAAKQAGVTRLCINPQSMVDQTLVRIGRSHTQKDILDCVDLARSIGFMHINMDIIAGLPGESVSDFAYTLEQIRKIGPESLTCHTLALKRGSALQQGNHEQTPAHTVCRMVEDAQSCAEGMGMSPYYLYRQKYMAGNLENVGYAKDKKACVYNIAMMDELRSIVALGVGSVGKLLSGDLIVRKPNPRDLFVYLSRHNGILEQKRRFFHVDKPNAGDYNNQNGDDEAREAR